MKPDAEIKKFFQKTNEDLLELLCQLAGRNAMYQNKEMHDAYWEARNEMNSRIAKIQEKDLIIFGLEEGAENWKQEYDNCREILQLLVDLKHSKDLEGKTEFYEANQPLAWGKAFQFLEKYQHY